MISGAGKPVLSALLVESTCPARIAPAVTVSSLLAELGYTAVAGHPVLIQPKVN